MIICAFMLTLYVVLVVAFSHVTTLPTSSTMPTSHPSTVKPSSGAFRISLIWTGTTFCFFFAFPSPEPPLTLRKRKFKLNRDTIRPKYNTAKR